MTEEEHVWTCPEHGPQPGPSCLGCLRNRGELIDPEASEILAAVHVRLFGEDADESDGPLYQPCEHGLWAETCSWCAAGIPAFEGEY